MGWLVALGLLVAFSAALLHPYGRKLLAVMFGVVVVLGIVGYGLLWLGWKMQDREREQEAARDAAAHASTFVISGNSVSLTNSAQ